MPIRSSHMPLALIAAPTRTALNDTELVYAPIAGAARPTRRPGTVFLQPYSTPFGPWNPSWPQVFVRFMEDRQCHIHGGTAK
jgi:hypothetical protein